MPATPLSPTLPPQKNKQVASTYVKVSFGRYLLELDLLHPVDDSAATATAKQGVLTVTLPKAAPQGQVAEKEWPSLTLLLPTTTVEGGGGLDKAGIRERRAAAVAEYQAKERRLAEEARERRAELEQVAFRAQVGRSVRPAVREVCLGSDSM
jgi:hypothetical protein